MKKVHYFLTVMVVFALFTGCGDGKNLNKLSDISGNIKKGLAPDRREKVYEVNFEKQKGSKSYIVRGSTTEESAGPALVAAAASVGITLEDSLTLLPAPALEDNVYGVTAQSCNQFKIRSRIWF